MARRPSFQFYPGDWRNDEQLRLVSVGARGLWIEMMCIMHQAGEHGNYGHLMVGPKVIDAITLARLCGATQQETETWLEELSSVGVFARDDDDCIYSRRMVRDEKTRVLRSAGGKLGGNPKLGANYNRPGRLYVIQRHSDKAVKIGISVSPSKRIYKIRQQFPGDDLELLGHYATEDMGLAESSAHDLFESKRVAGEWFSLEEEEISTVLRMAESGDFTLKVKPEVRLKGITGKSTTPSSSSSSSSSAPPEESGAAPRVSIHKDVKIPPALLRQWPGGRFEEMWIQRLRHEMLPAPMQTTQLEQIAEWLGDGVQPQAIEDQIAAAACGGWRSLGKRPRARITPGERGATPPSIADRPEPKEAEALI